MSKEHIDSSISDFLKEEGVFEEAQNQAIKEVAARQFAQARRKRRFRRTHGQGC